MRSFGVWDVGFRVLGLGCSVYGLLGFGMQGLGFWVWDLGIRLESPPADLGLEGFRD